MGNAHTTIPSLLSILPVAACGHGGSDTSADADDEDAPGDTIAEAVACTSDSDCDDGLYCTGAETCSAAGECEPGEPVDCDDDDPCTTDSCREYDESCTHWPIDEDDDGVAPLHGPGGVECGTDCDDADPATHPGAPELCPDSIDQDCDGLPGCRVYEQCGEEGFCRTHMTMIHSGTFTMGSPETEPGRRDDETEHQVTLTHDFEIMAFKVTTTQFDELMGYTPYGTSSCTGNAPWIRPAGTWPPPSPTPCPDATPWPSATRAPAARTPSPNSEHVECDCGQYCDMGLCHSLCERMSCPPGCLCVISDCEPFCAGDCEWAETADTATAPTPSPTPPTPGTSSSRTPAAAHAPSLP